MSEAASERRRPTRRWALLVALVVIGAIVGLFVAVGTRPMYTATASSYVSVRASSSVSGLEQGASFAQQAGQSYAALATNSFVLQRVIEDLHLATTPEALARRITAQTAPHTVVLTIDVVDPSAVQAARIANAVQERLGSTVGSLAPSVTHAARVTAVQRAVPPTAPSSPSVPLDVVLGALGGAAVRLLMALVAAVRRWHPSPGGGLAAPSMF